VWGIATAAGLVTSTWWVVDAARHRRLGVDLVAVLALAGSLAVGEQLAGALIALMLATGRVLERRADEQARRDLTRLVERAPRTAHRYGVDGIETVDIEVIGRGERVLVQPGEVVPLDGLVIGAVAVLDESALTGEPLPVEHADGDAVRSGVINAGGPFDLQTTSTASDSTYAGIVRLVEQAEAATAPFVRLADRYAIAFLAVTLAAASAAWLISGDPVRAVAVLVVATPCPLLLAAPVAIVSGLSRAARRGVLVKGGAVLERLAGASTLLFDKTGTLTAGRPVVTHVIPAGPDVAADDIVRMAGSVEQLSPHVLAAAVVQEARRRGLRLELATEFDEIAGQGATGTVDGHRVAVGKLSWLVTGAPSWAAGLRRRTRLDGALSMVVAVDGLPVGAIVFEDPVRPDAARTVRALRRDGIDRIVMVTGDRADVAATVGAVIGVDDVLAERTPAEKVDAVRIEARRGSTVMVGDGINDAPALALADVGVAIGARGATASSEAADIVLTADRLDRIGEGILIARRSRRIARQSVIAGMALSIGAMAVAAAGLLPPTWGALLQEVIDLAVIANALRVLRPIDSSVQLDARDAALVRQFSQAHEVLRPGLDQLRQAADAIGEIPDPDALRAARDVHRFLVGDIAPHEQAEDSILYPVFTRVLGGTDPTATMSRGHAEIAHLTQRIGTLLDEIDPQAPNHEDLLELRRTLYGLHAVLVLHFAQEDESYLSLADEQLMAQP
ncbi:MAG: heavy metal translocating P-type ATPase, partial [Ilumatobacteraceae bacterium]